MYTNKQEERESGAGPTRIGSPVKLSFDLYSMLFVTTMYPDYIYAFKKKKAGSDEIMDKMIKREQDKLAEERAAEPSETNMSIQHQDTIEGLPVPEDEISTRWLQCFEEELGVQLGQGMARKLQGEKEAIRKKIQEMIGIPSKAADKEPDNASIINLDEVDMVTDESLADEANVNLVDGVEDKPDEGPEAEEEDEFPVRDPKDPETKDMRETKSELNYAMQNLTRKLLAVWIFQLVFCFAILHEVYTDDQRLTIIPPITRSFCQFIAGMLM